MKISRKLQLLEKLYVLGMAVMAMGFVASVLGMLYALPGTVDTVDPILEATQDAWLLFMDAHGVAIASYGFGATVLGAWMAWFADKRLTELKKWRNHFLPMGER